jgi:hypothetical protein
MNFEKKISVSYAIVELVILGVFTVVLNVGNPYFDHSTADYLNLPSENHK